MDKMTVDSAPASGSANLVTSGGVFTAINNKADASTVSSLQSTVNTINTYAIKSAGTAGQVWTSDGSGAGKWADPAGGKSIISNLSDVITFVDTYKCTVLKDFEIQYIYTDLSNMFVSDWLSVSAGTYQGGAYSLGSQILHLARWYWASDSDSNPFNIVVNDTKINVCMGSNGTSATMITTADVIGKKEVAYKYRIRA